MLFDIAVEIVEESGWFGVQKINSPDVQILVPCRLVLYRFLCSI